MDLDKTADRRALVVGNASYRDATPLRNPGNDAKSFAETLSGIGFHVDVRLDADASTFRDIISSFCRDLAIETQKGARTEAVFFFAGHGVQVEGINYLLPVDGKFASKIDLKYQAIELDVVLEALSGAANTSVVLLDCCRNNPLPRMLVPGSLSRSLSAEQGLASLHAPKGVYVAFSTQPHFVALDGEGDHSPFTDALLRYVKSPDKHVSEILMDVRKSVYEKTNGQQIPWDHSALFEPFSFVPLDPTKVRSELDDAERERLRRQEDKAREASYWEIVKRSSDIEFIQSFLTQYPNSEHRATALKRLETLRLRAVVKKQVPRVFLALVGLAALYTGSLFLRTEHVEDAYILSSELADVRPTEQQSGFQFLAGIRQSETWCRVSCLFNRNCVALTYLSELGTCIHHNEAYYFTPWQFGGKVFSEITPGNEKPRLTAFNMLPYRILSGAPVAEDDAKKVMGNIGNRQDPIRNRYHWKTNSPGLCQKACDDLKSGCEGFTYVAAAGTCQLFREKTDFVREKDTNEPFELEGVISGQRK